MNRTGRSYDVETMTVHLQCIGRHPAVYGRDLKAGDKMVFNYGGDATVTDVTEASEKFMNVTFTSNSGADAGTSYTRRYGKDRLVPAIAAPPADDSLYAVVETIIDNSGDDEYVPVDGTVRVITAQEDSHLTAHATLAGYILDHPEEEALCLRVALYRDAALTDLVTVLDSAAAATITTGRDGSLTDTSTVTVHGTGESTPIPAVAPDFGPWPSFRILAALTALGYRRVGGAFLTVSDTAIVVEIAHLSAD